MQAAIVFLVSIRPILVCSEAAIQVAGKTFRVSRGKATSVRRGDITSFTTPSIPLSIDLLGPLSNFIPLVPSSTAI
ncbi:hypothetical protein BKA64DRAFT_668444 [Cadophora sp. MPI-SDFR-AT-0126]|nr:hypothetical protein BKA64DRAFT_668444 [Leotiomycetes sp. MPI-SDFR-AT-0126]